MLSVSIGTVFILLIAAVVIRIWQLRCLGGNIGEQDAKRRALTPRKVFRITVHCVVLTGIFFLLLTPDTPYDWMCGEEEWNGTPSASCSVPDDSSGDSGVLFAGVLLAMMIAVQLILAARANNGREVALPAIFIVLAICAWWVA
ncbi:MAG: hypothetical protein LBI92_02660 [Azoarcus sp.]|jgi:protein-S-isoprenylcysteine O-methyltransferase Ste14|nr:hypothetical protein [Azoarcus sp.]